MIAAAAPVWGQDCGPLRSVIQYGPYDYRKDKDKLDIVEFAHFTRDVELLIKGASGALGGDIDYTLRAFPNHPRALMSLVNYALKTHTKQAPGTRYTVDCYFERAAQFAEDDGKPRMIYAIYLDRLGKKKEALDALKAAEPLEPDNVNLQYNMGLAYFDLKEFDLALQYAQRAYRNGAKLPGLKNKLVAAGVWREPLPQDNRQGTGIETESAMPK